MSRVGDSTHGIEASQDHDDKEKREERREEREERREKTEYRPKEAAAHTTRGLPSARGLGGRIVQSLREFRRARGCEDVNRVDDSTHGIEASQDRPQARPG